MAGDAVRITEGDRVNLYDTAEAADSLDFELVTLSKKPELVAALKSAPQDAHGCTDLLAARRSLVRLARHLRGVIGDPDEAE